MALIDLRRFHINNEKEAIEFLELVASRVPEAIRHMKKQSLKIASLNNIVEFERAKNAGTVVSGPAVSAGMVQGTMESPTVPVTSEEDDLLEAMKVAAAGVEVEPGEVGQLKSASVSAGVDDDTESEEFKTEEEKPKRRILGIRKKKSDK